MTAVQVSRPSVPRSLGNQGSRLANLEAGLGPWNYLTPINGWANAGGNFADLAVRRGVGPQTLEFQGHITGGVSGTVCAVLDVEFWPDHDESGVINLADTADPTSPFVLGQVFVEMANGQITVVFPNS